MDNFYKIRLLDEDREVVIHRQLAETFASAQICMSKGADVYFQWKCLHCGVKQTFPEPKTFHIRGQCEECKGVSDLTSPSAEVGFMMMAGSPMEAIEALFGDEASKFNEEDE